MELKSLNGKISLATKRILYAEIAEEADRIFEEANKYSSKGADMEWSDITHEAFCSGQHIALFKLMIAISKLEPSEVFDCVRENPA